MALYSHSTTGLPEKNFYGSWIAAIAIDTIGNKWIGKCGSGLSKFDGKVWKNYFKSNSGLPSDSINSVVIDPIGNIWIGTFGGIARFDGANWTVYNTSNSKLPSNIIYKVAIDKLGQKWIGTKDGLAVFDDINWTIYNNITWVSSICFDNKGNKWIGTSGNGIFKFDNQKWDNYTVFNSGLPTNWAWDLVCDKSGNIWIGTYLKGLTKFDGKTWVTYNESNSELPDNNVKAILIDKSGVKWVGTDNGFASFDGTHWTVYVPPITDVRYNDFWSITKDDDDSGIIWLGTIPGLASFYDYSPVIDTADLPNTPDNPGTGINENMENSLMIYPNPVVNCLILGNVEFDVKIEIYDIFGKLLLTQKIYNDTAIIDVSYFQSGTYFIKIHSNKGFITKKIVKQ